MPCSKYKRVKRRTEEKMKRPKIRSRMPVSRSGEIKFSKIEWAAILRYQKAKKKR